ncbi:glycosyltransferase family 4 protein [Planctomycetota bacterium]
MASTIQITVVTHYYAGHGGGVEIIARDLSLAVQKVGPCHITWAASQLPGDATDTLGSVQLLPMRATNIVEERLRVPFPLWSVGSLLRLYDAIRQADVVHLHDTLYLGNVSAFLFAKLLGRPVVVTQHIGAVPYRSRALRGLMQLAIDTVGRVLIRGADRVVFYSTVVRDYYRRRFRLRSDTPLLPNGVDTSTFRPASGVERTNARHSLDLKTQAPILLFVGRFVEKKGLHVLRGLASQLQGATWVFAGAGPLDPESWQLENVLVLRGRSGSTLAPVYQAADLLVLPSVGEGLPLVIQEAMACGTPVMCGSETARADPAMRPLIYEAPVDLDAIEETTKRWVSALRGLLKHLPRLRKARSAFSGFARERWSWTATARAYFDIYSKVSQRRRT